MKDVDHQLAVRVSEMGHGRWDEEEDEDEVWPEK
tara:strand:+ start:60 stop:161 length:102 start_codon:yes stop_codon:yes gene_type:complete